MSSAVARAARRHAVLFFFVLAYALSWFPSLFKAHSINSLGPLMAALIVLALTEGWAGLKRFLAGIVRARVGLGWYPLVVGIPPLFILTGVGINVLLGADVRSAQVLAPWSEFVARAVFIFFAIGLGEEPAWRGFALPRLSAGRSILGGSLLLGVLHAIWHLPLFGLEYDLQNGVPWFLSVLAFSVLTAWIYRHTRGSLLLPALFHTAVNTFTPLAGLFTGSDVLRLRWLFSGLYVLFAIGVILATGPNLIRSPRPDAASGEALVET